MARRRRAERVYACGALEQFRAARSTRTLGGDVTFFQRLLRVEFAAQVALIGYVILFAAAFLLIALIDSGSEVTGTTSALQTTLAAGAWIALLAYLYSLGPVALVIAPIYALVEARGFINLLTVALVGLLPGAAVIAYSATPFAMPDTVVGLKVACLVTGMSVAYGIYLVRTWRTEQEVAA